VIRKSTSKFAVCRVSQCRNLFL